MSNMEPSKEWVRVEVRRTFDVPLPRARVWQVVADTQHLNQMLYRLEPMRVLEMRSDALRVRGGYGIAGPEFEELPWEFRAPERYRHARLFHRGVFRLNDVEVDLTALGEGGTRVDYTNVMFTTRTPLAFMARLYFTQVVSRSLRDLEQLLLQQSDTGEVRWPFVNPTAAAVLSRARPFADGLAATPAQQELVETLVHYLAASLDDDVASMRPYVLAGQWGAARDEVLSLFLRGTKSGLLELSWDLLCPSCESASRGVPTLSEIPEQGHCPACDVTWDTAFERNVEATFRPSPAVREVTNAVFCFGSPMRTPHWLAQVLLQPGEARVLEMDLGSGRYRLQGAGVQGRTLIDVREAGASEAEVRIGKGEAGVCPSLPAAVDTLGEGALRIALVNDDEQPRRLQLAHRDFAWGSATAADVTALGIYRDLFGGDVLAPGKHVRVGRTAILFTDLVSSTEMYERIGDAAAYGLVWRHFAVLEEAVVKNGGRVVKTIGDAVMASFPRAIDAVRAGWAGVEGVGRMQRSDGEPAGLALKAGVHEGPCLAVNANEMSDYFGRTVNVAARVQGLAGAGELVVSSAAREAAEVEAYLEELGQGGAVLGVDRRRVKGVPGDLEVTRVRREAKAPALVAG